MASGDRKGSGAHSARHHLRRGPGSMVALVGPSGAGKTTITSLVARLYDPTEGAIRVNGVDLRDATFTSLYDRIGVVTQEAHLFHDTLRANLLLRQARRPPPPNSRPPRAAQVWHLVESLPAGLDTVVGDRGHRLSGGEKQRFAIARLLLKGPGLVVLDEATAHLDSESEAAVQRALDAALADRTSIVIAQSAVDGARRRPALVVDAGRIVERGSHVQLLAQGGLYADLYRTQFAEQAITAAQT
ncbi:MAG: ATP-binding cassette domain-containing protein [Micropruina glycogenica]